MVSDVSLKICRQALGIFDTFAVKQQTLRTSIEAAAMLLRNLAEVVDLTGRVGNHRVVCIKKVDFKAQQKTPICFEGTKKNQPLCLQEKSHWTGIDDIISGISKKQRDKPSAAKGPRWICLLMPLGFVFIKKKHEYVLRCDVENSKRPTKTATCARCETLCQLGVLDSFEVMGGDDETFGDSRDG